MISMEQVRKTYKMGENIVNALDGISMEIKEKEFVAIIGPSGSGKSTLMNIIGCLDSADEGTYALDNKDITKYSERQLATVRNQKIGFIFQSFNLLNRLSARENVELPLLYQNMNAAKRKKLALAELERVGLSDRWHHKPNELSGGQQQRVAIARALVCTPSIILADEPTGNLDSKSGREIMELLKNLHEDGRTVIVITHDQNIAGQADRQICIQDGRIVSDSGKEAATV